MRATGWGVTASRQTGYYWEYIMTPTAGSDLTITDISFYQSNSYTNRSMNVYYSTDNFSTETQLGGDKACGTAVTLENFTGLSITVPDGSNIKVRCYFWNLSSYRGCIKDMTISGTSAAAAALPISLIYFDASLIGKVVLIKWKTVTEKNNDYFTIEKTTDWENFEIVGKIDDSGNSHSLKSYEIYDFNIDQLIIYYRLTQTDYNGNTTYYKLISINNTKGQNVKKIIGVYDLLGKKEI